MCKESMQKEIINNKKKPPARSLFYRNPDEKRDFFYLSKVTKLTSCMNFRMIQAVIKCFERSTVERIEENANEVSRCFLKLFSKRVSSRSSRVPNQFNIIRFRSETGRNSLRYRGPVIWNFVNRLVKVPESFYSFKQILRKYVKIIDNFSFDKGATVVANKKDHFIYF